jgi:L-lactate dehydrogenase complex protein LldG
MDTSQARKAIFERIRSAQHRPADVTPDERAAVAAYLQAHPVGPQPVLQEAVLATFCRQAERMSVTVAQVAAMQDVPGAVADYLQQHGLPAAGIAWQTLQDLPWQQAGIALAFRPPVDSDVLGITGAFCAVAETGTLMLLSGEQTYPSASLLPETHIAIVAANRIVAHMEDAFALLRAERGELPRATNFISGPSRTGDIEQTIVLGAHGPYRVHVIIVGA